MRNRRLLRFVTGVVTAGSPLGLAQVAHADLAVTTAPPSGPLTVESSAPEQDHLNVEAPAANPAPAPSPQSAAATPEATPPPAEVQPQPAAATPEAASPPAAAQPQPAATLPEAQPTQAQPTEAAPAPDATPSVASAAPEQNISVSPPEPAPDIEATQASSPDSVVVVGGDPPDDDPQLKAGTATQQQGSIPVTAAPDPNAQPIDAALQGGGADTAVAAQPAADAAAVQPAAGGAAAQPASSRGGKAAQPAASAHDDAVRRATHIDPPDRSAAAVPRVPPVTELPVVVQKTLEGAVEAPGANQKSRRSQASRDAGDLSGKDTDGPRRSESGSELGRYGREKGILEKGAKISKWGGGGLVVGGDLVGGHGVPYAVGDATTQAAGGEVGAQLGLATCVPVAAATELVGGVPCALWVTFTTVGGSWIAGEGYKQVIDRAPGVPDTKKLTLPTYKTPTERYQFYRGLFSFE